MTGNACCNEDVKLNKQKAREIENAITGAIGGEKKKKKEKNRVGLKCILFINYFLGKNKKKKKNAS